VSAKKKLIPCKNLAKGECSFGRNCHYSHDMDMGGGGFFPGGGPMGPGGAGVGPAYYQAMGQSPLADYSDFDRPNGLGAFTSYSIFHFSVIKKVIKMSQNRGQNWQLIGFRLFVSSLVIMCTYFWD
jgi:hypothetical protein